MSSRTRTPSDNVNNELVVMSFERIYSWTTLATQPCRPIIQWSLLLAFYGSRLSSCVPTRYQSETHCVTLTVTYSDHSPLLSRSLHSQAHWDVLYCFHCICWLILFPCLIFIDFAHGYTAANITGNGFMDRLLASITSTNSGCGRDCVCR